ncbi:hypothetical protein D083_1447 [Dickeya solani RNS 08.23.3.1.A]|nr:hypothetical protein D083_1447 [Dickeya solani RNS 08.23.3.1.A]
MRFVTIPYFLACSFSLLFIGEKINNLNPERKYFYFPE